ncbi:hypothetical protein CI238_08876 [Colletotrichum incanum]|uniref:Uncharacterized protein n=1 Tax=Colletotrichum incanum TaxID=1573173 RepID=A0A166QP22_COLIC|nr:hypothetical protein CI238_08876 [Colletotrichum incanum]
MTTERAKTVQISSAVSSSGFPSTSESDISFLSSALPEPPGPILSPSSDTRTSPGPVIPTRSINTTSSSMSPTPTAIESSGTKWRIPTGDPLRLTSEPPTITILPPSAFLLTLSGIKLTTPHYITTTSPGGNDPTVVPVIFPFKGPPLLCFGCYIHFPPNVAIKLPQFCIRLFGLKIGKYDKEEKDDKKSSKTKSTSSASSTSSCTITVTATLQTVFCSITRSIDDGTATRIAANTTCLTSAYTAITGCSVVNSIATVTTTRTFDPRPSVPICGPECGSEVCPAFGPESAGVSVPQIVEVRSADMLEDMPEPADPKIEIPWPADVSELVGANIAMRGDPHRGEWVDPSDYHQGYFNFMKEEFRYMRGRKPTLPGRNYYNPNLVPDGPSIQDQEEKLVTVRSNWVTFGDKVETLGIEGLTGCTVVLVVSHKGAWMGKFYEATMMDNELFENALYQWRFGAEEEDEISNIELTTLGTTQSVGNSAPCSSLLVYEDGTGTPMAHWSRPRRHNYNGNVGELLYYDQVGRIADDLKEAIPHVSTVAVDYPPQLLTHAEMMMRNQGNMGEAVWSVVLLTRIRDTPRGKVMLQYQPAKTCNDQAAMRWWVDALPMLGDRSPNLKIFSDTDAAIAARRQACPIKSNPASSIGLLSLVSLLLSRSAEQGMPGAPTAPGASGDGMQPPPTDLLSLNKTKGLATWNNSMTTELRGHGGGKWMFPTSLPASDGSTASVLWDNINTIALSGSLTAGLLSTASRPLNGTMDSLPGKNSTTQTSDLATLETTTTATSLTSTGMINETSRIETPSVEIHPIQSDKKTTPSIHTTIYVTAPSTPVVSLTSVSSSTTTVKRITVTASVQKSVVRTVTIFTSTVIVPAVPTTHKPPVMRPKDPPRPGGPSRLKKSEAVYIMHEEVLGAGSEATASGEMWVMLPVKVDSTIKHCEVDQVGWKSTSYWRDRSWPPNLDAKNGKEAFGRKKCKYKAKQAGFGAFSCEGITEFICFMDPDYDKTFNCEAGLDYRTYKPRMRCVFPGN